MLCQLYRHYDADDNLLYVGISLSALMRLMQHRDSSDWFLSISKVTIENFPTREKALEAETNAIVNEKPKHNIAKRKAKYKPQTYKEVKQKLHEDYEKIPEYYNDKFMFKINEACEILGMERNQIFDMRLQKKIIIHQICGGRVSGREINRILAGKPLWRLYAA